nr:HAD-IIIC family phosphatase [uncultured Lichenicoccus sp.]
MTGARAPEGFRLVIWDLDETFWHGTLTEGGITRNEVAVRTVVALAERGIVSAICSKNDLEPVQRILVDWGLWEYFVFPSVNWEAKGPRIRVLVDAIQLRPETILFIDDNSMNRKEASHFVPGLQVADETVIGTMLDDARFTGKDDAALTRLKQYRLLQARHADLSSPGTDVHAFLRASGITVEIEHDVEAHLDRAIELVNRTNQLNFIKARLPETIEDARSALREHLGHFFVQAGLVRVRDRYGDYGFVGFFLQHRGAAFQDLAYYCFSCRILGMYVETWLYRRLGRPNLRLSGEVLTNLHDETVPCDWISLYDPGHAVGSRAAGLGTMFIGGGCDLEAVAHYVNIQAGYLHLRLNTSRTGIEIRRDHTQILRYAIEGIAQDRLQPMLALGYNREDLAPLAPGLLAAPVWLLSFWADAYYELYRNTQTDDLVPFSPAALGHANLMTLPPEELQSRQPTPEACAALDTLRTHYEPAGRIDEAAFKHNVRTILDAAPPATRILVLLMGERPFPGMDDLVRLHVQHNRWLLDVLPEFASVTALAMDQFVLAPQDLIGPTHYERLVYQRLAAKVIEFARAHDPLPPPGRATGAKWYFAITRATLDADPDQGFRDCIRAAVASSRRHTDLRPHLLYDGDEDEFTAEMRAVGVTVLLHRLDFHAALQAAQQQQKPEWPDYMQTAAGAFMRLDIGLLETEEEFVLYTDCDVMFEADVGIGHLRPENFAAAPQFRTDGYFDDMNCGVMVINVARLRRDRAALIEFMCENFARVAGYDQELLRLYYNQRWDPLSPTYNWKPYWGANPHARIVHFHGPKPAASLRLLSEPDYRLHDPVFQTWRHWFAVDRSGYEHYVGRWSSYLAQAAIPATDILQAPAG